MNATNLHSPSTSSVIEDALRQARITLDSAHCPHCGEVQAKITAALARMEQETATYDAWLKRDIPTPSADSYRYTLPPLREPPPPRRGPDPTVPERNDGPKRRWWFSR